jgi:hypothetical protein
MADAGSRYASGSKRASSAPHTRCPLSSAMKVLADRFAPYSRAHQGGPTDAGLSVGFDDTTATGRIVLKIMADVYSDVLDRIGAREADRDAARINYRGGMSLVAASTLDSFPTLVFSAANREPLPGSTAQTPSRQSSTPWRESQKAQPQYGPG